MSSVAKQTGRSPTDEEILDAIERADVRAVNGLPDSQTVAEHIDMQPGSICERVRKMDCDALETHRSIVLDSSGEVTTFDLDGDAR